MKCVEEVKRKENDGCCENKKCRYFIEHQKSKNCTFICIENHGRMSSRQISEIIGTCTANISIIEKKAIKKIAKYFKKEDYRD